jgi:hypothetical protein
MAFMPKLPPTLPVRMRTLSGGTFSTLGQPARIAEHALAVGTLQHVAPARPRIRRGAARLHRRHDDAVVLDVELR